MWLEWQNYRMYTEFLRINLLEHIHLNIEEEEDRIKIGLKMEDIVRMGRGRNCLRIVPNDGLCSHSRY